MATLRRCVSDELRKVPGPEITDFFAGHAGRRAPPVGQNRLDLLGVGKIPGYSVIGLSEVKHEIIFYKTPKLRAP